MKPQINVELLKVTPEMASEWLQDRWGEQRSVRPVHVKKLLADMVAGRFHVSPDAIVRIKGKLANGQHRLDAVVQYGKAVSFLVMESNDEELYKVIDSGLRRTPADGLIGLPYAKSLPAIARWVMNYESQILYPSFRTAADGNNPANASGNGVLTHTEMIEYCISNQETLSAAASFIAPLYSKTRLLPMSIGGAIYVIGDTHNKLTQTQSFLQQVYVDGGVSAAGDLRNRLISNQTSKAKLNQGYVFGISIKALKSFLSGTRPGNLKWAKGEEIPQI